MAENQNADDNKVKVSLWISEENYDWMREYQFYYRKEFGVRLTQAQIVDMMFHYGRKEKQAEMNKIKRGE